MYLCQVAYYLDQCCNLDEECFKNRTPQELLEAGAKKYLSMTMKMVIKLGDGALKHLTNRIN